MEPTAAQLRLALGDEGQGPSAAPTTSPPATDDADARHRIAADLASTLFVEAGAGSGKTKALVDRIVALVKAGEELAGIAAITFTEKAGAELRERLRRELGETYQRSGDPRYRGALDQLDGAAVGTLHSFAQRLLSEHPIEAALPPGVEVMDELASQIDFDDRWAILLPRLLSDDAAGLTMLVADALGIGPELLRSLARQLEANWDLVAERVPLDSPEPTVHLGDLVERLLAVGARAAGCLDPEDKLALHLGDVAAYAAALAAAEALAGDEPDLGLAELAALLAADEPKLTTQSGGPLISGRLPNWPGGAKAEIVDELLAIADNRDRVRGRLQEMCLHRLGALLGSWVLEATARRRREGRLHFHDLLVLARELLADPTHGPGVRRAVRARYPRVLIDEFQDTDPIQMALALLIGTDPDAPDAREATGTVDPGRLFFVGDPKQSIYRFRRADIGVYLAAAEHVGAAGHVALTANFRSTPEILAWVNHVFAQLIVAASGVQPPFVALQPVRPSSPVGPGLAVIGADPIAPNERRGADRLRVHEADLVASAIGTIVTEGWTVGAEARPARLGDICILLPSRLSLPSLERALEEAGIPYRAEAANLVFASTAIRELLLVARAIDDPTDELAVVAALRTAAFGCGDDDLYAYRQTYGGRWDHQSPAPDDVPPDHPVGEGLRWMAALHVARTWLSPSELLDRIVRERGLLELAVVEGRHQEVWRRLRYVVDQARSWADTTGGTLREFLVWARLQGSDTSRTVETVLPETDLDAVRIMTVHASKGLTFPITIVTGLTTKLTAPGRGVQVSWGGHGPPGYFVRASLRTAEFDAFRPVDEQMDAAERYRLLYVACTRAADHLVVSLARFPPKANPAPATLAEALIAAGALPTPGQAGSAPSGRILPDGPCPPLSQQRRATATVPLDPTEWAAVMTQAIAAASRSSTVSATTVARWAAERVAAPDPGLAKEPRDLDLPPWLKGRYGTALGRAVHAVLQAVDLRTGAGLAELAAGQAAAEGLMGRETEIVRLASNALGAPLVHEAAASPHWREVYVAAPAADRLLEGYIDLLYRSPDGLVIVDHKTDHWTTDADLDTKVARYRLQMAAYALAVEAATGETVAHAVLLFLAGSEATARTVADLGAAKAEVAGLLPAIVSGGEAVVE